MKYAIPTIADTDLEIAASGKIGAEHNVYFSYDEALLVAEIKQGADLSSSTLRTENAYQPPTGTDGRDMILVADNGVRSEEQIIIVFDITIDGTGTPAGTATATFVVPTFEQDQTFNLPIGLAVDLQVDGTGNEAAKIRTITGINAITGGRAGNRFKIITLPDTWEFLQCSKDKTPTIPVGKTVNIACGYEGARWTKKGRSEPPTLEVSGVYTSAGDGLMRLNGHRASVMIETVAEDEVLMERLVFAGWRPAAQPRMGDGDTETEVRATGNYEKLAIFV
jgi:hypothetical protein